MIFPEEKYMRRCLEVAASGKGRVAPNPMVGAVIVHQSKIIGEGYHRMYGEAHAEVNAIETVKDKKSLRDATLYVNLEPCSHYGKTPPCAERILREGIPHVVVGHSDPNPIVSGRGIQMLRDAGAEVICDFLKPECEVLNKRFLTFHLKQRPYVFLKWAQSNDGFLDRRRTPGDGSNACCFSDFYTQTEVHKMRAEEASIMIGTNTALLDNPLLNVRLWAGQNPLRVTIDRKLKIPDTFHLHDESIPTLIFTDKNNFVPQSRYLPIDFSQDVIPLILEELYRRKIQSLIVEGGAFLLDSFIQSQLWDEARIEISNINIKDGIKAPKIQGREETVQKCKNSLISVLRNDHIP